MRYAESRLSYIFEKIQETADRAPKGSIRRIEDMAHLQLEDPEMQAAFYHMMKGTITRDQLKIMEAEAIKNGNELSASIKGRAYVSLLTYIHFAKSSPEIRLAPKELLKAIFENEQVVDEILIRRNELSKENDSKGKENFSIEFNPKRKTGLSDQLLNFKITKGDKSIYD